MSARRQRAIPLVERIAVAISLSIIAGTLGYLLFESVQPRTDGARLTVHVAQVWEQDGAFIVEVEVRNESRRAASEVHLAGWARSSDGSESRPQARIDYVPGRSTRRASLVFGVHPGERPAVRIAGYTAP